MANHTADLTGYIFIACCSGGVVAVIVPYLKEWVTKQTSKSRKRRALARFWLRQFKPGQVAVIQNYLDHGGFSEGVSATLGDMNFLVLSGEIGETLRNNPELLEKAMFGRYSAPT